MDFVGTLYGRPNTIKTQKCLFNRWIKPYVQDFDISKEENILKFLQKWEANKLSFRTIKSLLSLLHRYSIYINKPINCRKYATLIMRREQRKEIKAFDKNSAKKVIDLLQKETKTIVMLAYYGGLRKGEAFGLNWGDIDFFKKKMMVQRSYAGPTKNGKSRVVRLADELEGYLLDILPVKEYSIETVRILEKEFNPNYEIRAACQKLGIPEGTLHTFRHTFATLALESGRSPKQVQEALGHSSVSITMDLYWQNIKGDLELGFC